MLRSNYRLARARLASRALGMPEVASYTYSCEHEGTGTMTAETQPLRPKPSLLRSEPAQPEMLANDHNAILRPSPRNTKSPHHSYSWFSWRQANVATQRRPRWTQTPPPTDHPRHVPNRTTH
jgi:hypothetical protein